MGGGGGVDRQRGGLQGGVEGGFTGVPNALRLDGLGELYLIHMVTSVLFHLVLYIKVVGFLGNQPYTLHSEP